MLCRFASCAQPYLHQHNAVSSWGSRQCRKHVKPHGFGESVYANVCLPQRLPMRDSCSKLEIVVYHCIWIDVLQWLARDRLYGKCDLLGQMRPAYQNESYRESSPDAPNKLNPTNTSSIASLQLWLGVGTPLDTSGLLCTNASLKKHLLIWFLTRCVLHHERYTW